MAKTEMNFKQLAPGLKAINFDAFGGLEGFLRETSTGAGASSRPQLLRRVLPWLAKATDMTALAVSELPFDIMDGNTVYDSTDDWKNKLGGIPSPQSLLYLIASSLCLGKAYVIPQALPGAVVSLQYCAPQTILPQITSKLNGFNRTTTGGGSGRYLPADVNKGEVITTGEQGEMMYFWLPDSDVELGPAESYPASTALISCELLTAVDSTLNIYAQRGFVPATILAAKGMANAAEREKTETWWNRFLRGWTNTIAKIINADAMTINKVGAGLDELRGIYGELNKQAIENIGTAYGIPAALFMSDMAFASEVNPLIKVWYTTSQFVKIYRCIEKTFNTQLLDRYGLTMKFRPESIDAFQEDEVARSAAMSSFMDTVEKAGSLEMFKAAIQIYGFEVNTEAMTFIEKHFADKQAKAEPAPVSDNMPMIAEKPEPIEDDQPQEKALDQWQRKAIKRLKDKGSAACEFVSDDIPQVKRDYIAFALEDCKTADDVRRVFDDKPADQLKRALDYLELHSIGA